ncbi:unnamed protein product, partial [Ectocarpus sp. 13 AM-2016]
LAPGQSAADRPDIVLRVFRARVLALRPHLEAVFCPGGVSYSLTAWEFQHRGLPHAHIVLRREGPPLAVEEVDEYVSAEMPGAQDPLRDLVQANMVHRHTSRCSRRGDDCSYGYPFGRNDHTRIEDTSSGPRLLYRRRRPSEDGNVVSYNPTVLRLWGGHVNTVAILDMRVFEYLLGYVLKGA